MEDTTLSVYLLYIHGEFHRICSSKKQAKEYAFRYGACDYEIEIKEEDVIFESESSQNTITKTLYMVFNTERSEDEYIDTFPTREEAEKCIDGINFFKYSYERKWYEIREKQITFIL